jgi:2-C-methyl-D-erythritol 4-phosphate cytidylyltransferase
MGEVVAVVLAAGAGRRMGGEVNKVLLPLRGRSILARSLAAFDAHPAVSRLALVGAAPDIPRLRVEIEAAGLSKTMMVAEGGSTRCASERNGLEALSGLIEAGEIDIVLVHDAARPLVSADEITSVIAGARRSGGAVLATPMDDPDLVWCDHAEKLAAPPSGLWAAQTPQAFAACPLLDAHRSAAAAGFDGTDTASIIEWQGLPVEIVEGDRANIKITTPEDMVLGECLLSDPHLVSQIRV